MPGVQLFNAESMYLDYILQTEGFNYQDGYNSGDDPTKALLKMDEETQYQRDVGFWYGTLLKTTGPLGMMLRRVFLLLSRGGLMYKNQDGKFVEWSRSEVPIASALSHGGRVMIQLPTAKDYCDQFWAWLWGNAPQTTRMAATHGIGDQFPVEKLGIRSKSIKEQKKSGPNSKHYGVNIALGGQGNKNPFSEAKILPNGEHGHLYLHYQPPIAKPGRVLNGGILIGCEGSAPIDHAETTGGWLMRHRKTSATLVPILAVGTAGLVGGIANKLSWGHVNVGPKLFAKDQTGHKHTFGSSGTFSPTGGRKWKDLAWHSKGPGVNTAQDTIFLDIQYNGTGTQGFEAIMRLNPKDFDLNELGSSGDGVQMVTARMPLWSYEYWKIASKGSHWSKRAEKLKIVDENLKSYQKTHNKSNLIVIKYALLQYISENRTMDKQLQASKNLLRAVEQQIL